MAFFAQAVLTREIFGNIPVAAKVVFYVLAAAALGSFFWGVWRRVRLWRLGRGSFDFIEAAARLRRFLREVLLQRAVLGRGAASLAHVLLFWGFVVLLIGTTLIAVEHVLADLLGREAGDPVFHRGLYFAIYELTMDAFGLAFLLGCVLFALRRARRPASLGHRRLDWAVLVLFIAIGVSGYLLEALRIIREATPSPGYSFVGQGLAVLLKRAGLAEPAVSKVHFALWWTHAVMSLGVVAVFPYTRLLHAVAGVVNVSTREKTLGALVPVSMEEVEKTGQMGVGAIPDFTRRQLLELDACVSCGRCQEACPAFAAGKPLSPRDVVQDVKGLLDRVGPGLLVASQGESSGDGPAAPALHGDTIAEETLWSCTTCSACTDVCPLGVSPLGLITDMRRYLIGEGRLRGAPSQALQKMQRSGNPWGLPPQERFDWAEGLDVPTVASAPDFEILYWVGCAASYDRRIQRVARSMVALLKAAGCRFAVLGSEERCTGESARRMGEEFVFQELAMGNIETLRSHGVRKIVTHCPHCLNSFRRDYPQFDGSFEVVHHSEFLRELIERGELRVGRAGASASKRVTYHDPCYLARVNGISDAPRQIIGIGEIELVEMDRRRENTACCGGGGGRMWFDDAPAERIGQDRVQEALGTGAGTVAVSCPFCLIMMKDGVATAGQDEVEVRDIAEILAEAVADPD